MAQPTWHTAASQKVIGHAKSNQIDLFVSILVRALLFFLSLSLCVCVCVCVCFGEFFNVTIHYFG
jgi:hypothetical protein